MFLKHKRDGKLHGRTCADGSTQRGKYEKEDAASPTVAVESVIITSVVDAKEGRDVAIVDIPSAYLHADMDDEVHMRLTGKLAELLVATAPEMYREYVTYGKNKEPVLYVKLKKGTLRLFKKCTIVLQKACKGPQKYRFYTQPL